MFRGVLLRLERIHFRLEICGGKAEPGVVIGDQRVLDEEHLHDVARGPAQKRYLRGKMVMESSSLLINPK